MSLQYLSLFNEKSYEFWWCCYFFLLQRVIILNRTKDYYNNDKERLRDNARDQGKNLSVDEENKKREYGRNITICQEKRNGN